MGRIEVFPLELWPIGVSCGQSVAREEVLQAHEVTTVAVFSHWQVAIRWTMHPDPVPGQHLARAINEQARALHAYGIDAAIH
jgi:hypothetical protein